MTATPTARPGLLIGVLAFAGIAASITQTMITPLIALLPGRSIATGMRDGLTVLEPPVAVEGFPVHLAWHRRREGDAGVRHVAATLREVVGAHAP